MIEDDGILLDFIQEAKEHLEGIENDLLLIEEQGIADDGNLINKVFRAIHSIKGGSGFFGLENIKKLAHVQENILNSLRNKELAPTSQIISLLLTTIDTLKKMVNDFRNSNTWNIDAELANLSQVDAKGGGKSVEQQTPKETSFEFKEIDDQAIVLANGQEVLSCLKQDIQDLIAQGNLIYLCEMVPEEDLAALSYSLLIENLEKTGQIIASETALEEVKKWSSDQEKGAPFKLLYATILEEELIHSLIPIKIERLHLYDQKNSFKPVKSADLTAQSHSESSSELAAEAASAPPAAPAAPSSSPTESHAASTTSAETGAPEAEKKNEAASQGQNTLRVPVKTLNTLMTLAGELVLTRNQLAEMIKIGDLAKIKDAAKRIDVVTSDLRVSIMGTRLQPIDRVFSRFNRVVRDLANQLNKKIDLTMEGKEVELDSTIIEMIGDPLTHLVRNAVDHGIEMPEDRLKKGKKENGTLQLKAYHEAGHVIIEIIDDGKGIDANKIKEKAAKNGLYTKADLDRMEEREIVRLIFLPGFSLADKVTEISGRGVGMDVVQTNFTKLGGTVDIDTKLGHGSTIRVKLPLTMAIITGLIVSAQKENFVLPQANLLELIRVAPHEIKERIKKIGDMSVLQLRGDLLPLVYLSAILGLESSPLSLPEAIASSATLPKDEMVKKGPEMRNGRGFFNIAVVGDEKTRFGLIVDDFLDTEEIVVKPLGNLIQSCEIYAGSTIRGDGHVALILDITAISETLNLSKIMDAHKEGKATEVDLREVQPFLIVRNSEKEQFAIPLALISRIERVNRTSVEKIAGKISVRYRERSLPLVALQQIQNVGPMPESDSCYILTFKIAKQEIGLIVAELVDSAETKSVVDDTTFKQTGILGSFIWAEKTTLLVDLFELAKQVYPELMLENKIAQEHSKHRVLIVDDSRFYRNQIKQFVEDDLQLAVETAEDGDKAFELLNKSKEEFHLVLTDIEMPNLDGYGLTRKIRASDRFRHLPICAITSLAGKESRDEAYRAGVDCYMVKLDREELRGAISQLFNQTRGKEGKV